MKIKFFLNCDKKIDTQYLIDYINIIFNKVNINIDLVRIHKTNCGNVLAYMDNNLPKYNGLNILIHSSSYPQQRGTNIIVGLGELHTTAFNIAQMVGLYLGLRKVNSATALMRKDKSNIPTIEEVSLLSADDLFPVKPLDKQEDTFTIPSMVYPVDKEKVTYIANCLCWNTFGERENTFETCVATYNSNSKQGYKHNAIDFTVDPEKTNYFINPFKSGVVKVTAVVMKYPDNYGEPYPPKMEVLTKEEEQKIRKGQRGNYIELTYYKDGNQNHTYPNNIITCYGCHLKQDTAMVKVGDIIEPNRKLAEIGWSGYTTKKGSHLHFEMNIKGYPIDLFELGVYDRYDFNFNFSTNVNLYPEWYKKDFTLRATINDKIKFEAEFFKEYLYTIKSDIPIFKILHTKNPFGDIFEYNLLDILNDVNFKFSQDRKTCKFKFIHRISGEWLDLSKGVYEYVVLDDAGNKTEPFYIRMV